MNRHLREGVDEEEFVKMRKERDGGLDEPRLLHQSLQVISLKSALIVASGTDLKKFDLNRSIFEVGEFREGKMDNLIFVFPSNQFPRDCRILCITRTGEPASCEESAASFTSLSSEHWHIDQWS